MKPSEETFRECAIKYRGNICKIAEAFNVRRCTVYNWINEDKDFDEAVKEARAKLFYDVQASAIQMAIGIPNIQEVNGVKTRVGWIERPDPYMQRYFMSCLGRQEGFSESIDITTNGKDINGLFRVLTKDEMLAADEQFDKDY